MGFAARLYVQTDARRSARRAIDAASTLRTDGEGPFDVQVTDISRHGFACLSTADIQPGDAVTIGLRGAASGAATVRWRRGALIGCEFLRPLSQAEADALFSQAVIVPGSFPEAGAESAPPTLIGLTGIAPHRLILALLALGMIIALAGELLDGGY